MYHQSKLIHVLAFLTGVVAAACWSSTFADSGADECLSISDSPPANVRVDFAEVVSGNEYLPTYCRIIGEIGPSIGFEMRLPLQTWNSRLLVSGCGAYCGEVAADRKGYANSINFALQRGYAAITTDAGHKSARTDTVWAYNNPRAEELYAHAWVPLAVAASREMLQALYAEPEQYAYFSGCSNGGRTAAKVAQLYPELFDGIASGAPGINATFAAGIQGIFLDRTLVDEQGQLILRAEKMPMLSMAVNNRCDSLDGLIDGIVSDPAACDFDPATLQCSDDVNSSACLTKTEVEVVKMLHGGIRDSQDKPLYYGLPFGSEPYWARWLLGAFAGGQPHVTDLGSNFLRYLGFKQDPGPNYHSSSFNLDTQIPELAAAGRLFNATDPDLGELHRSGAKLLMYHGLADPLTVYQEAVNYYESVVRESDSAETVNEYFRLFLIPGADHCWGVTGHAPDLFDPLLVLEDWVEKGLAPDRIEARQYSGSPGGKDSGTLLRTRPLCPYPERSKFKNTGSPFIAGSFACELPGSQ